MREIQLHGTLYYEPTTNKWVSSGTGWWINHSEGSTATILFEEPMVFTRYKDIEKYVVGTLEDADMLSSYTLTISNINHNGDVETFDVDKTGFKIRWNNCSHQVCIASFTVIGAKNSYIPNDRDLSNEDNVADIYAASLLFDYEAKYGVVSVMGSASITSRKEAEKNIEDSEKKLETLKESLKKEKDPNKRKETEEAIKVVLRKIKRFEAIRDHSSQYWDSAYKFGTLWGEYSAREQEVALGGRYVPICTGGGPGIMQAAAEGARANNAHVIGIDCQFGYDDFFNLKNSYMACSNQRLRMNNLSIREGVLLNYSHVILFWPGGYGTLWEVAETLSKIQTMHLRQHRTKAILVHSEYWKPFFELAAHMRNTGTINAFGDRIKIPGVDDKLPDEAYAAEVVDTAEEAFEKAKAFVEELNRRNQLTLRGE